MTIDMPSLNRAETSKAFVCFVRLACGATCFIWQGCATLNRTPPPIAAANAPDSLHYESNSLPGFYQTNFDVVKGVITKRHHGWEWDGRKPTIVRQRTPNEAEWARFWRTMTRLQMWDWKKWYEPRVLIDDGNGWSFSCRRGANYVETHAGNACPQLGQPKRTTSSYIVFDRLTQALEQLVDPEHGTDQSPPCH
jgi:hypothetical protein